MKKTLISCMAFVVAFMAVMGSFAGTALADAATSYILVLNDDSNGLLEYLFYDDYKHKTVAFTDMDGDGTNEMLFIAETGQANFGRDLEVRVWTYRDGSAKLAGTIHLVDNTAAAGHQDFIYLMNDQSICHVVAEGDEFTKSVEYIYYGLDSAGNLTETKKDVVRFEQLSYGYPHDYDIFLNDEYNSWGNTDHEFESEAADRVSGFNDNCKTMLLNIYYTGSYTEGSSIYAGVTKDAAIEYLKKLALAAKINGEDSIGYDSNFTFASVYDIDPGAGRGPDEEDVSEEIEDTSWLTDDSEPAEDTSWLDDTSEQAEDTSWLTDTSEPAKDTSWLNDDTSSNNDIPWLTQKKDTSAAEEAEPEDDEDAPAEMTCYEAYRMIADFYDENYGARSIFTDYSNNSMVQENIGVFLDLVDFDHDGTEELVTGYMNADNTIALDVWEWRDGKVDLAQTLVYPLYGFADDIHIQISEYSGRTCIIAGTPTYLVSVYGYNDDGTFCQLEQIDQSGREYGENDMYQVVLDGEAPLSDSIYYICMWSEDLKADVKQVISETRTRLGY